MFILWIGKAPTSGDGGDEVFDRKTITALRDLGHIVSTIFPKRAPRWLELWNLARGIPNYRAAFATEANRRLVQESQLGHDLTICSWEPLDVLAFGMKGPLVLVAHNITSQALRKIFPRNPLFWLLAFQAGWWEKKLYSLPYVTAIATLSKNDRDYLVNLPNARPVVLTIPGMPPVTLLKPEAKVVNELVLAGTYEWRPKRRDAVKFAKDYLRSKSHFPILGGNLPRQATDILPVSLLPSEDESADAIRFGIISDRFESGHKLKTLAYIAQNQIVLSLSEVNNDISDVKDHYFFVRRIKDASEILGHVMSISRMDPGMLRDRLVRFQLACAERYNWEAVAITLVQAGPSEKVHKVQIPELTDQKSGQTASGHKQLA
ncbi:glycosyltransferase family protein [Acidisoma silvae]|uniref:Uncharacterized protein n=1 Tax=Acidisoma silvae TaxID=2802396 RepID=A0A964E1F3_9PROT|nr:hypothetical protein [Acidisoma silvae]MCB8878174.1 hypothetical protein [Acidisoma silvae]